MELLLTVEYPRRQHDPRSVDLTVDIEPYASVSALHQAIVEHGERLGIDAAEGRHLILTRPGRTVTLDPEQSVFSSELVNGDRLQLSSTPVSSATPTTNSPHVLLDVVSGPDVGRTFTLEPGIYTVGRSNDCEIVVDDATLSRRHVTLRVSSDLTVSVESLGEKTNQTLVSAVALTTPRILLPHDTLFAGSTQFVVRTADFDVIGERDRLGQIAFNRCPYRPPIVRERKLKELPAPPEPPGKQRFSVVAMVTPLLGAGAIAMMTGRLMFLVLAALSPLMLISNYISEGRNTRRAYAEARKKFEQRVDERRSEVDTAISEERGERLLSSPDVPFLVRQATGRLERLWERQRQSPDFLAVRLGIGDETSRIETPIREGGDEDLRKAAEDALAHHTDLHLVPIGINLRDAGTTGISGNPTVVDGLARSIIAQAALLHSPEDLVIAASVPSDEASWQWLKWLPHTRAATSPIEGAHLTDESRANDLLRRVGLLIDDRLVSTEKSRWPHVLLVLHESVELNRPALSRLLDAARNAGVTVLWVGREAHLLPRQCSTMVHCAVPAEGTSRLRLTDPHRSDKTFEPEVIATSTALETARTLAPVRDVSAANATTGMPRVVTLLDAISLPDPSPDAVCANWATERPYGLGATIGTGPGGRFELDLVRQGPHTLIGGTSGSGKSELLQTLVLSLAANYSPRRLSFLFIDYKGGASSADFADLPHNVGSVSNLDERLSLRALASLRAELRRRMGLLKGRAKDLEEMLAVAPDDAPPSLVIVIDEFATLVKEVPEFVAGIVDIAQRGRSLGIHLVLATQRPAGAVNDNILANTNLRIALRVLDSADSTSIIGTQDAADIPVPLRGRAYARTGPGPLDPFQCAWSGAPFEQDVPSNQVTVRELDFVTRDRVRVETATVEPAAVTAASESQLKVLVRSCKQAADLLDEAPPRRPWVEPLPATILLDDLMNLHQFDQSTRDPGREVVIGSSDAPHQQTQFPAVVDLEATGGLVAFGSGGSGKTTLLRTVAASLAMQGSPREIELYGIDFASRGLVQISCLPHVTAVATSDDPERVTRILTVLQNELATRRELLARFNAETLSALRTQNASIELPRIVLLLDGYAGFHSTFDQGPHYQWITTLQKIVGDGRQVGVHTVITNSRELGMPTALTSSLGARLVLRMSSNEEMIGLGVARDVASGSQLGEGRGFLNGKTEVQIASVSKDARGAEQARALEELARKVDRHDTTVRELPDLPTTVLGDRLDVPKRPLTFALGLTDLSLETAVCDLVHENMIVSGPPESGRSSTLVAIAQQLAIGPDAPGLVGIGSLTSPLIELDVWKAAGFGRARHAAALDDALESVAGYEGTQVKVTLFIDAAEDVESMENNPKLDALLRSDAVRVVAVIDAATLGRAYGGWMADLRRNRSALVLQPSSAGDVETIAGVKPSLRPQQQFPRGRGVFVRHGRPTLVQVAMPTSSESG